MSDNADTDTPPWQTWVHTCYEGHDCQADYERYRRPRLVTLTDVLLYEAGLPPERKRDDA